jgi:hypothetical protein
MRLLCIFTAVFLLCLVGSGLRAHVATSEAKTERALSLLKSRERRVNWNPASVLNADFDHDGDDDFAFSGTQDGRFVVAIIHDPIEVKPRYWVFRFSIGKPSRRINQICSLNAKINSRSPVLLGSGKRMWKIPDQSKAITLDDDCDPIDITWDQDKKSFEMFRIHLIL